MTNDLPRIGPTIPEVREYVTEVGVIAVCYAQLERLILTYFDTLEHLAQAGVQLPIRFKALRARKGTRPLGRLIEELRALEIDEDSSRLLDQVNKDRISLIHEAARLMKDLGRPDSNAILDQRRRIRECYARVRDISERVQESQYEVIAKYAEQAEAIPGPPRPEVVAIRASLDSLRSLLDRTKTKSE